LFNRTSISTDLGKSAELALNKLRAGNRRFVEGHAIHPHESLRWRESLSTEQHPFAAILGCSDSRVSPELLFDEGLGDLFVVRNAGHVADDNTLGSLEYAAAHLEVPLIVVLGHETCGAVTATVDVVKNGKPVDGHILRLVDAIAPAVPAFEGPSPAVVDRAIRTHIRAVVQKVSESIPVLRTKVQEGALQVVGAYYELQTGRVQWLDV
jgi:carbonic anhydrase